MTTSEEDADGWGAEVKLAEVLETTGLNATDAMRDTGSEACNRCWCTVGAFTIYQRADSADFVRARGAREATCPGPAEDQGGQA